MTVTASAPCRLDFAGGWTDVEPYATERGGLVVNAAIEHLATATVDLAAQGYRLESLDLGRTVDAAGPAELAVEAGLDLLRAAVRFSGVGPCRVATRSDAPPGSGLGSSGAMGVALVAALDSSLGAGCPATETAERAWRLEAVEARLPGGKQDQFAAALGGFQALTFCGGGVEARPLTLGGALMDWLEGHVVVCYTGQSRVSGDTITRVMDGYRRRDSVIVAALDGLAETADRMAEALLRGQVSEIGRLLTTNWKHQQRLDSGICTPLMAQLEQVMAAAGSLGGKAAGAGAGGSMFFIIADDPVGAALRAGQLGITVLPLKWAAKGIRIW